MYRPAAFSGVALIRPTSLKRQERPTRSLLLAWYLRLGLRIYNPSPFVVATPCVGRRAAGVELAAGRDAEDDEEDDEEAVP
jgi:hypothetical protein